jgi:ankyrin repeat protein
MTQPPPLDALRQKLAQAATRGDVGGTRAALAEASEPNREEFLDLALVEAAGAGQTMLVNYLLDSGGNANGFATTAIGALMCPLGAASAGGHLEAMNLLLDRGALPAWSLWRKNLAAQDPLCLASARDSPEAARLLLDRGAPANVEEDLGFHARCFYSPALCEAAALGRYATAELLLERGAKPEPIVTRPEYISTAHYPLTRAIAGDHPEICRLLLDAGANPRRVSHQALAQASLEVAQLVKEARGKPRRRRRSPQRGQP